jgi:NADH:ubiquinone oxidoreductase subunit F (NADH-binding)
MHIHLCGGNEFEVIVKRTGTIKMEDQGGATTPVLQNESDEYEIEFKKCNTCGEEITDVATQIVEAEVCVDCRIYFPKGSLDQDGKCTTCVLPPRPDLEGLTEKDYIRRILELEKQLSKYGVQDEILPDEAV